MQVKDYSVYEEQSLHTVMQAIPNVMSVYKAVTSSAGESTTELRQGIMNYAINPTPELLHELPETLQSFVHKVAEESYKVTDHDIHGLRESGYPDDFIFEITSTAATGAALRRFRAGIEALAE